MVLPLALLLMFGIIDAGRYSWQMNQLEKASQAGVRYAVVTDIVPQGLNEYDTSGFTCADGTVIDTADRICAEALGSIRCSAASGSLSCSCVSGPCPGLGSADGSAFANIVARIARRAPMVEAENVSVTYSGSGLGFSGDPTITDTGAELSDIAPLVTVEIASVEMRPLMLFGAGLVLPTVSSALTLEDGTGTIGY